MTVLQLTDKGGGSVNRDRSSISCERPIISHLEDNFLDAPRIILGGKKRRRIEKNIVLPSMVAKRVIACSF